MNDPVLVALNIAEGPVFRFALALAIFGLLRNAALTISDAVAAYLAERNREALWHKIHMRLLWVTFPTLVFYRAGYLPTGGRFLYHVFFSTVSLVFRVCAIVVPIFMVAHVYLWKRVLGDFPFPTFPGTLADTLSIVVLITGLLLFLGRVYSPTLRKLEPAWAFFKPLILLLPFVFGVLAMHPAWSPFDYHLTMLAHVLTASVVLAILPFARLFSLHVKLTTILPEVAWNPEEVPPTEVVPQRAAAAALSK